MPLNQSVAIRLEIERVNLLYKQNIQGAVGLSLIACTYAYVCGSLMSPIVLTLWLSTVVVLIMFRVVGTLKWNREKSKILTLKQTHIWLRAIQFMVLLSGILWAYAGWLGARATDPLQQVTTAIGVVFMAAGAIVCWAPSLSTIFIFTIPGMIPWSIGYLAHDNPESKVLGVLGILYFFIGSRAGFALNRYIDRSLKLNIENTQLAKDLKLEVKVKGRAEEALRLALSSSDAIEWRWNIQNDVFTFKGDLSQSLGLENHYLSGSLDEIARFFYSEDQEKFKAIMLRSALKGGELDMDFRILWPNQQVHDLAFRGKAQVSINKGQITHLTGIAWDTTAQKHQTKLQQEKDIHEAANHAKSIFLANASHEMRTPLAAINGYVENLLEKKDENYNFQSDLMAISRNGKVLTSLVNDFLDLSEIESGHFYMQKGSMSPIQEITDSVLLIKPEVENKNLKLEVIYGSVLPVTINSDPARFKQILGNLLSNSMKFTKTGKISVRIEHSVKANHEGQLSIKVTDTGVGIDDRTKSQLFEPFMRGQTSEIQKVYGSGLGLALAKNLALMMGGDLKLNYSTIGIGTEFEFLLATGPVAKLQFPMKKTNAASTQTFRSLKFLVVDDAVDLRVLMKRYLENLGGQVDTCENGSEAVEKAFQDQFDVILMDIKMPVMDGHEATRILRSRGYKLPIIAITAHASIDDRQKSLEVGCNYYLSKPVNFTFLTETILQTQKKENQTSLSN